MLQVQPHVQHNVRRMQRRHQRPQRVVKYGSIPSRWIGSLFGCLNAPCLNAPPLVAVARQPVPVQGASVVNIREADVARGRQLKVPTRRKEDGLVSADYPESKCREGGANEGRDAEQ
jgi:hypothetical protein